MRRKDREITDIKRIIEIIDNCKVFRVAMVDEGMPYVVPLNFGYDYKDGSFEFYFHCAGEGRKLDIISKSSRVCFEMDCNHELTKAYDACGYSYNFSSVIGEGNAVIVENIEEKKRMLTVFMKHQTGKNFIFSDNEARSVTMCKIKVSGLCAKERKV